MEEHGINSGNQYNYLDYQHYNEDDFDVYFARGHKYDSYPGNRLYRKMIRLHNKIYTESSSLEQKRNIVDNIIHSILSKGGRFYHQSRKNKEYEELHPRGSELRNKVRQALRDSATQDGKEVSISEGNDNDKQSKLTNEMTKGSSKVDTGDRRKNDKENVIHYQDKQHYSTHGHHNVAKHKNNGDQDYLNTHNATNATSSLANAHYFQQQLPSYHPQHAGSHYHREADDHLSIKTDKQGTQISPIAPHPGTIRPSHSNQSFPPMIDSNDYHYRKSRQIEENLSKKKSRGLAGKDTRTPLNIE